MGLDTYYTDRRILITGGAGTVGQELVRQLMKQNPEELRVIDNNEDGVFGLEQVYGRNNNFTCLIGDIRDEDKLIGAAEDMEFIFHAAALKHVYICERSPFDAVMTNIIGVKNVLAAALAKGVRRVVFTSTDKAVNPTNVMGTSKLMGERLITAANNYIKKDGVVFASTRFGNVLASRGSVFHVFHDQISRGGPVTLTHAGMTRFIMTNKEAVRLVLAVGRLAKGGEIFVPKMPVIRITDLAAVMIEHFAPVYGHDPASVETREIGAKPGEKLYEELMTGEEAQRSIELEDLFAILPTFKPLYKTTEYTYTGHTNKEVLQAYDSMTTPPLSRETLTDYLKDNAVWAAASTGRRR